MTSWSLGRWAALGLTVILLASSVAVAGAHAPGPVPPAPAAATPSATAPLSPTYATARAQEILEALHRSHIPLMDVHLPDFAAMDPSHRGVVSPTYSEAPAPMGLSDLGLTNVSGTLTPSNLSTSSAEGTIQFTNAQSVYVDGDGPNMFGVQLNSVDTGVTVFGNSSGQFWTQNFVSYTPASGELVFGDNIWNFSNPTGYMSSNVFYQTGPNGSLYAPIFYYAVGPTFTIHYPFTISFYNNATVLDDRPAVFFNYTLSNNTMSVSGSYDYVIFNSTAGTPSSPAPSGVFQVSGFQDDPIGLPNDIELDVVGNDDGDTTSFYEMQANLTINYWNATLGSYAPLPSAYDSGQETGETSDGVIVTYDAGSSVGHMTLGPSFLTGLWNLSNDPGASLVEDTVAPNNAFTFVSPGSSALFNASSAQWVPTFGSATTDFYVPENLPIVLGFLLSDYNARYLGESPSSNVTYAVTLALTANPLLGIYTPLFADGNAELAAISSGGTGTAIDPYLIENNEIGPLLPEFDGWNDYQFPVFPGLLLINTSAYVSVTPPSFAIAYPTWQPETIYSTGLPSTNNLQIQFWNVTNATLEGGTITGWLSFELSAFPEGSVMLWNSSHDLIASNTFLDQGAALALYGGSNNTIWGNTFLTTTAGGTAPDFVLNYGPLTQGINESESGDLIYNNYFSVPYPAITPTFDPLSCQIECEPVTYTDLWNISQQPASDFTVVMDVTLTGSIIGTTYQGGNYWSIYGTAVQPYGILPVNDDGWITEGGDFVPLIPSTVFPILFTEIGLSGGTTWGVTLIGVTTNSSSPTLTVYAPNGSYPLAAWAPSDYAVSAPGIVNVSGRVSVSITFSPLGSLQGAVNPPVALVVVNGASVPVAANGNYSVTLVPGDYEVKAVAPGYQVYYDNLSVAGAQHLWLNISLVLLSSSSPPPPGNSSAASSPSGIGTEGWVLIGALAALAAILAVTTVLFARRGRPPATTGSPATWSPPPTGGPPPPPPPPPPGG
jgi:thermopsin